MTQKNGRRLSITNIIKTNLTINLKTTEVRLNLP